MKFAAPTELSNFRLPAVRRFAVAFALAFVCLMPVSARAADEDISPIDARLENYPAKVALETSGTALSWIIFIILTGLCVLVMFKNANRSHLD